MKATQRKTHHGFQERWQLHVGVTLTDDTVHDEIGIGTHVECNVGHGRHFVLHSCLSILGILGILALVRARRCPCPGASISRSRHVGLCCARLFITIASRRRRSRGLDFAFFRSFREVESLLYVCWIELLDIHVIELVPVVTTRGLRGHRRTWGLL